jgi:FkbM family methyltransferase
VGRSSSGKQKNAPVWIWRAYGRAAGAGRRALFRAGLWHEGRFHLMVRLAHRWLLRVLLPSKVTYEGLSFSADPGFRIILASGSFEPHVMRVFKPLVPESGTVIDLGAHVGVYTLVAASRMRSGGRVFAFEPNPHTRRVLAENIQANRLGDRVTIVPMAVSNHAGQVKIHIARDVPDMSGLFTPSTISGEETMVGATSLDSFLATAGWPEVRLIKMDIEGSESAALEGMAELCSRQRRLSLITEVNRETMAWAGSKPEELLGQLHRLGFVKLFLLSPDGPPVPLRSEVDLPTHNEAPSSIPYLLAELG